jgi:hypothetical protein
MLYKKEKFWFVVLIFAACVFLINFYFNFLSANNPAVGFKEVVLFFFSRHLLCFLAAYYLSKKFNINISTFVILFILPSLLLFHVFIFFEPNGELDLWPPILILDLALFYGPIRGIWPEQKGAGH